MNKILLFFLLFFTSFVYSQVRFEGVITDSMGNTIMGANVIAVEKESQILDGFGISNNSGFYRISLKKKHQITFSIIFNTINEKFKFRFITKTPVDIYSFWS